MAASHDRERLAATEADHVPWSDSWLLSSRELADGADVQWLAIEPADWHRMQAEWRLE